MNFVHEVINYISNLPPSTWTTLASYIGASTLVASVLQVVKHKLNFADAQKLVVFALGFLSFLAAFADFIISANPTLSALPYISRVTALLMAGAMVMHRFAVSPAYYNVTAKLKSFNSLLQEAEKEQLAPAGVIPAEVVNSVPANPVVALAGLPDESNLTQFQV